MHATVLDEVPTIDEKPLTDVKRGRYATDNKRHGIYGKTARKLNCPYQGIPLRDELDRCGRNRFQPWPPAPQQKFLWTALEVEGRDYTHSLDRDLAWEHIPKLLNEHAIRPPAVSKRSDGVVETTYLLEPIVEEVLDAKAESDELAGAQACRRPVQRWTDGKLYTLRNGKRPTLFAVPPTTPPEEVTPRSKLLPPVRMGDSRNARCFPVVRRPSCAAWDVAQHGGVGAAQLDIDLGVDCVISHVSTQGRQPPTRIYPEVRRERRRAAADLRGLRHTDLGRRAQRALVAKRRELDEESDATHGDLYWVEGRRWDLLKHGQYPGPFWDVLDLRGDEERCKRSGRLYQPHERWLQWVSKYEIRYRVDGGRHWHLLGVYKGNCDATSEVAHDVRGLRARYLRIVPLEAEGMGALRVGVYGHTATDAFAPESGGVGDAEAPEPIAYCLRTCPPSLNTRWTHCAKHTYRGGSRRDSWCRRNGLTVRGERLEPRLLALHERDEFDLGLDDDAWNDDDGDSGDGDGDKGMAVGAAGTTPEQFTIDEWLHSASQAWSSSASESSAGSELVGGCWEAWQEEVWSDSWSELSEEEWLYLAC